MEYQSENSMQRRISHVAFFKHIYYPDSSQIEINGEVLHLNAKEVKFLNYLIENIGNECHKEVITRVVWDTPKTNKEPSFNQYLTRLRKYLGDTHKPHQVIIKTATQGGYTLTPKAVITYEPITKDVKQKATYYQRYTAVACLFVIIITMVGYGLSSNVSHDEYSDYKAIHYRIITSLKGQIKRSVTSPDGSIVIFSHRESGNTGWDLVAKNIHTKAVSTLVIAEKGMHHSEPGLSPSGKQLAWIKNDYKEDATCRVMVADVDAANLSLHNVRELLDCSISHFGRSPQWRTENRLLVSVPQGVGKPNGIIEVDLNTNEKFNVTSPTGKGYGEYALSIHLQANQLAYLRLLDTQGYGAELRVYDFTTHRDRSLKYFYNIPATVTWADSDNILIKSANGFEMIGLDGSVTLVTSDNVESAHYPFSMGDKTIGFVRGEIKANDINVIDLVHQSASDKLSSAYRDYRPVIAKVAENIGFVSIRDGKRTIFKTTGTTKIPIAEFHHDESIFDMAISPNGQWIAVTKNNNRLVIINRQGDEIFHEVFPLIGGIHFSKNGDTLFYCVITDNSNTIYQLSLMDFSSEAITTGFMPKEDEQGSLFFFRLLTTSDKPILHKMPPDGNITELFEVSFRLENSNSYDVTHNRLYYVDDSGKQHRLMRRDLSTHEITEVTPITSTTFSLNKDATKLVTTKPGIVQNNLASFRLVKGEFVEVGD